MKEIKSKVSGAGAKVFHRNDKKGKKGHETG